MNLKQIFENLKKEGENRVFSPFFGSFLISLIIYNWDILFFLLFDSERMSLKIKYLQNLTFWNNCFRLLSPFIVALVYLIAFDLINYWTKKLKAQISNYFLIKERKNQIRLEAEASKEIEDHKILVEEKTKTEYDSLKTRYEKLKALNEKQTQQIESSVVIIHQLQSEINKQQRLVLKNLQKIYNEIVLESDDFYKQKFQRIKNQIGEKKFNEIIFAESTNLNHNDSVFLEKEGYNNDNSETENFEILKILMQNFPGYFK